MQESSTPASDAATPPEPARRPGVLRTGALKCWDTEGREIADCRGTGQDAEFKRGNEPPLHRFDPQGDVVVDNLTGLTWLKDANRFGEVEWEDALSKARSLGRSAKDARENAKAEEWRLPNIRELLSLIDYGRADPILPEGHPFENVEPAIYWTSTTLAPAPLLAWMVTLGIGPTVFVVKRTPGRMWPVRGVSHSVLQTGQRDAWDADGNRLGTVSGSGQDGEFEAGVPLRSNRFFDDGNGTVRDELTGLVWLKNADAFGFQTWSHALACCRALKNGQAGLADGSKAGNWRLPNVREIESLVDYGRVGPSIPANHPFQNVRPSSYWTSTTVAAGPTEAMFIILGVGPSIFESKEHQFFVWPVRDPLGHE